MTAVEAGRPPHVRVGPVSIFNGDIEAAARFCVDRIRSGAGARVATANLDFLAQARGDATLRADLSDSTLVVADGAPVAWLGRMVGGGRTRRVPGVDLVAEICRLGTERRDGSVTPLRVALYGAEPEVAAEASAALTRAYPGTAVVLSISPPFRALSAEEEAEERARVAAARPELVLVALGCPKQERLIARYFQEAPQAVWIGVGGTFDFLAQRKRRAPRALQRAGLEWAFRLAQEPGRLWRRYVVRDLPALIALTPACVRQGARHALARAQGRVRSTR